MKEILFWIATSALGAITFVAYAHPDVYNRSYKFLLGVFAVVMCGMVAYNAGVSQSQLAVSAVLDTSLQGAMRAKLRGALDALQIDSAPIMGWAFVGLYFQMLWALPIMGLISKDAQDRGKR